MGVDDSPTVDAALDVLFISVSRTPSPSSSFPSLSLSLPRRLSTSATAGLSRPPNTDENALSIACDGAAAFKRRNNLRTDA